MRVGDEASSIQQTLGGGAWPQAPGAARPGEALGGAGMFAAPPGAPGRDGGAGPGGAPPGRPRSFKHCATHVYIGRAVQVDGRLILGFHSWFLSLEVQCSA
jgi:hypothetical protein